ncbi:MAG: PGPGW domain-containing protein [Deltaproteobacteria bacterium]|nr:PGPGW domain-containing protein [Deltaproteobacteria bacterium]
MKRMIIHTLKQAKRVIVIVIGFTILLVGIAMIVLPGPAFIVIPLGLAVLATEFIWARRLLKSMKARFDQIRN